MKSLYLMCMSKSKMHWDNIAVLVIQFLEGFPKRIGLAMISFCTILDKNTFRYHLFRLVKPQIAIAITDLEIFVLHPLLFNPGPDSSRQYIYNKQQSVYLITYFLISRECNKDKIIFESD